MGRAGFEHTKAEPADLQSAPVDRLGTSPRSARIVRLAPYGVKRFSQWCETGAGSKNRTRDLRITSALLYLLSYAGVGANTIENF